MKKLTIREIAIFGVLGALMYASKLVMEGLPNIHLVGVFVVAITVVFRAKAQYPIYVYVLLCGLFSGFGAWWIAQTYVWTVLWGVVMLLPKSMPKKITPFVYMIVCSLHGFLYGVLYAPAQALFFGLSFKATLAWIGAGAPFDILHGVGNFVGGLLIVPLVNALRRALKVN